MFYENYFTKIFKVLVLSTNLLFINNAYCSDDGPLIWNDDKLLINNPDYIGDLPKVEDPDYGFEHFNTTPYNYCDISTLNSLFSDGNTYNGSGLTNNMPSTLLIGLIGDENSEITIKNPTDNIVDLYGWNDKFNGTLNIQKDSSEPVIIKLNKIALCKIKSSPENIKLFYYFNAGTYWDINRFGNNINLNCIQLLYPYTNTQDGNDILICDTNNTKNKVKDLVFSSKLYDTNYELLDPIFNAYNIIHIMNLYQYGDNGGSIVERIHFKNSPILNAYNEESKPLTYVLYNDSIIIGNSNGWYKPGTYTDDYYNKMPYNELVFKLASGKDENGNYIKDIKLTLIPVHLYRKLLLNKNNTEFKGIITIPAPDSSSNLMFGIVEYDTDGFVPVLHKVQEKTDEQEEELDSKDLIYNFIGDNNCRLDEWNKAIKNKTEDNIELNEMNIAQENITVALSNTTDNIKQIKLKPNKVIVPKYSRLQINPGVTLVI